MAATEKVGIEIELMNADEAYKTLRQIDETVRNLGRKKTMIKLDDGSIDSIDNQIKKIQDRLDALRAAKKIGVITPEETEEAKRLEAQLRLIKRGLKDGTAEARTFKQEFNSISSKVAHIGSALQSFGNAMTTLTSPFRRITDGILMGTGYKLLNSFTEGFEKGFTRYDTMKKYPKIMAAFGYSAEEAQTSIDALDKSVRGLPTGLDEMVDLAQRFTATTGDIDKGTKLAIAANNAFLASMSTDTQKYQGMMQLQDVLGGKDMNAREWNSLVSSMTPAIVKMGESLGYTSKNMDEWIQKVRDGKVDNEDFIDTLIKIGNEGGVLEAMARESKDTWQAFFANVGNAASRMMAKVITSMDEVVKTLGLTDKDGNAIDSVNLLLSNKLIPTIDDMAVRVQKWIKAHPEEITNFFKDLKSIDWGGLVRGYVKGMGLMLKVTERFFKLFNGKGLGLVGGFLGAGGGIGKASTIIGGLLKGTRHLWALLGVGGKWLGGKLGKIGIFGRIAAIFGSKKSIEDAGKAAKAIPSVADTFKGALNSLSGLIKVAGAVLITSGTAYVVTEATKRGIANFKEALTLLRDVDWSEAKKLLLGIGAFIGGSAILGGVVGKFGVTAGTFAIIGETIVGLIATIGTGFADINMALIKGSIKKFVDSINLLKTIPDVSTFGDVKAKISNAITMMNEISSLLNGEWAGPGMHEGGVSNIGLGAVWGINTLAKALAPMKTAVQRINEIASMSISEGAVDNIRKIIKTISDIQAEMWRLMGLGFGNIKNNMKKVADAMYEMRRIIYHVNKLSGEKINKKGLKNITDSIKAIGNAFDGNAIADVKVKITGFVAAINDALTMFDKIKDVKINAKVTLSRNFYTSVDKVVKDIDTARKNIRNAWNGIPTYFSKTITFELKAKVIAENLYAGASKVREIAASVHPAKGGLIYRAKGGGVPWKRRGTDTVPAMLTPGEYVHNKRAVSTFGIDFMRKVNNLDVKGAMNELMHRAGNMANVNRGTTINNYNNNQRVVINNNGNPGAGFTFKSASRFVGAI